MLVYLQWHGKVQIHQFPSSLREEKWFRSKLMRILWIQWFLTDQLHKSQLRFQWPQTDRNRHSHCPLAGFLPLIQLLLSYFFYFLLVLVKFVDALVGKRLLLLTFNPSFTFISFARVEHLILLNSSFFRLVMALSPIGFTILLLVIWTSLIVFPVLIVDLTFLYFGFRGTFFFRSCLFQY